MTRIPGWVWPLTAAALVVLTGDWFAGAAVVLLWFGWYLLSAEDGPPVLALAFTSQWMQVTLGIFYFGLTARYSRTIEMSDYRPMVLIGLGCLLVLALGLRFGTRFKRRAQRVPDPRFAAAFTDRQLVVLYLSSIALLGVIQSAAYRVPSLTQGILVLRFARYILLFMIFRRLVRPRLHSRVLTGLLSLEVALGFTGYFAGFREALVIAGLALLESFDARRFRHWLAIATLSLVVFLSALVWTGIKSEYRSAYNALPSSRIDRVLFVGGLTQRWFSGGPNEALGTLDQLVDRLWAVYYPALALSRVPTYVPHTNGEITWQSIEHIFMPRLFFPNKSGLRSDSDKVREYSGIWVAGPESGTSIAFGYAAELYIDFGIPGMFLPLFVLGAMLGLAYRCFVRAIVHRDLAVAMVTVIFWLGLYLFERSWGLMIGLTATMMIFLGGATILLDRVLLRNKRRSMSPLAQGRAPALPPRRHPAIARGLNT